jgi:hypothetical protein
LESFHRAVCSTLVMSLQDKGSKDDFVFDDNELPTLAPAISSRSERSTNVDRYGDSDTATRLHHHGPETPVADASLSVQGSFTKRRPSAIRRDTGNTINLPSAVDKDVEPSTGGLNEPPEYSYPPTASASVANLPRLSFHQNSSTPELSEAQRKLYKRREWAYFAAVTWSMTLNGWNDGTVGPLMPVIQRDYRIGFTIAALLFVSNFMVRFHIFFYIIAYELPNAGFSGWCSRKHVV